MRLRAFIRNYMLLSAIIRFYTLLVFFLCDYMRLSAIQSKGNTGKMCNVDQHASIVDLHYLPLFAFHAQRVILSYGVIGIAKFLFLALLQRKKD